MSNAQSCTILCTHENCLHSFWLHGNKSAQQLPWQQFCPEVCMSEFQSQLRISMATVCRVYCSMATSLHFCLHGNKPVQQYPWLQHSNMSSSESFYKAFYTHGNCLSRLWFHSNQSVFYVFITTSEHSSIHGNNKYLSFNTALYCHDN